MRALYLIVPTLVLMTLAVFWQTTKFDFVGYDDDVYVVDNPPLLRGVTVENIFWAFSETVGGLWQPLVLLSYMVDVELHGLRADGFHLTNVILHTFNVLLVYALLWQLTGKVWRSAFVAALFAVHPLRVESVAWVTERKDVLSSCFGLIALIAWVFYVQKSARKWYWAAWLGMACSLMSKQMLVTFPFLLLLLDFWPLRRIAHFRFGVEHQNRSVPSSLPIPWPRLLREKIPFFLLTAAFCVIAFEAQRRGGATESLDQISITARLANAIVSWGVYLWMTVWPAGLAVFYPHPKENIDWTQVATSASALTVITVFCFKQMRRKPYLLTGWLWYLGALVPVIGIVQVGQQQMADRFTYVPLLGVFIAVTWGISEMSAARRFKAALPALSAFVLTALAVAASIQTSYWRNSVELSNRALAVTRRNHFAHNNLGVALQTRGHMDAAAIQYRKALEVEPRFAESHYNLGTILLSRDQYDAAIQHFRAALQTRPFHSGTHNNLGIALRDNGRTDEAMEHFLLAASCDPNNAQPPFNLGTLYIQRRDLPGAAKYFRNAVKADPAHFDAQFSLGTTLAELGQLFIAVKHLNLATELAPDNVSAHTNLGVALSQINRSQTAIQHFRDAIRLDPSHTDARVNLARVLAMHGNIDEAEEQLSTVLKIDPHEFQANMGMGMILMQQNKRDDAIRHLQAAVEQRPDFPEARQLLEHALGHTTMTEAQ